MANDSVIICKANPLESCLDFGKGSCLVYSFQASNTLKVKTTPHSDRSRHASMTWCDPLKSNILSMPKLACLIAITKTNTWRLLIGLEPLIGLLPVSPVPTNSPRWRKGNCRQRAVKLQCNTDYMQTLAYDWFVKLHTRQLPLTCLLSQQYWVTDSLSELNVYTVDPFKCSLCSVFLFH